MTLNPYDFLEVPKNADERAIRDSYRALVKKYHPDTDTGNQADFEKLKLAHDTLIDANKRAIYDEYGIIPGDIEADIKVAAYENLKNLFFSVISKNPLENLEGFDLLGSMDELIVKTLTDLETQVQSFIGAEKKQKKALEIITRKMKRKNKKIPNIFIEVLQAAIAALPGQIEHVRAQQAIHLEMKNIMENFNYDYDKPDALASAINRINSNLLNSIFRA